MKIVKTLKLLVVFGLIANFGNAFAQSSGDEISIYRTKIDYIFGNYGQIFSDIKWTSAWMDPDMNDAYEDKNWLGKFFIKKGKTNSGLECSITLYKGHFLDYEFHKPLVKYEDSTGLVIVQKGSSTDTNNSTHNQKNKTINIVVLREGGGNCGEYGCDSPWHTTAKITSQEVTLINELNYQPTVSCKF